MAATGSTRAPRYVIAVGAEMIARRVGITIFATPTILHIAAFLDKFFD